MTIDGVILGDSQEADWHAIRKEAGTDALADEVFSLCHVHDGERWVSLDMFETAERDPTRSGAQYGADPTTR